MTRTFPARQAAGLVVMLALLGAVLAGCTKKVTAIDPSYTLPEGRFVPGALLLTYPNTTVHSRLYGDADLNGQYSVNDTVYAPMPEVDEYLDDPADLYALILDSTAATTYQMFRRETNGAVRNIGDPSMTPARKWLDTHWEIYSFTDPTRSGYVPPTYIGRGLVSGIANAYSPLTNFSSITSGPVTTMYWRFVSSDCPSCTPQVDIEALQSFPRDSIYQPKDSLFVVRWTEVAGAAGYWIQVYQEVGNAIQRLRAAQASPIFLDASRDFFIGFVPAPADSYKIGTPGAMVLTRKLLLNNVEYRVRVSAVDNQGKLIGFLYGDTTTAIRPDGLLGRVAIGAMRVKAKVFGSTPF
jgi:hypothetical protein